jgi:hypothetical protein
MSSGTRSQKLPYKPLFKIDFLSSFTIILMDAKYYDKLNPILIGNS